MKTAFLRGRKIERIVYFHPTKEVNTKNVWKLKKCVYGLIDISSYSYRYVREELLKLVAKVSSIDPGLSLEREQYTYQYFSMSR